MADTRYKRETYAPLKSGHGYLGTPTRRWHSVYADYIYDVPAYYLSTMTGDETFTDPGMATKAFILDPNGANRNFNPSGSFNTGFIAFVKNTSAYYNVIFDSTGAKYTIGPKELGILIYNGSSWA